MMLARTVEATMQPRNLRHAWRSRRVVAAVVLATACAALVGFWLTSGSDQVQHVRLPRVHMRF
jgi:cytochrome c-type biogenesis protein CcmH/NrfG